MNYIAVQLGSPFHRQWQMSLVFGALEVALSQVGPARCRLACHVFH